MPITAFNANFAVATDGASLTWTAAATGTGSGTQSGLLTLTATDSGGNTFTIVQTIQVTNGATGQTETTSFDLSSLPPGTYSFQIVGTQTSGGGLGKEFYNSGAPLGPIFVCFLAGTMISTPDGEVAVEALSAGDLVMTADGRAVPVLWLGRQTASTVFGVSETSLPVRIAAGALGHGLPVRDLCVTAGHALLLDGVLVDAGALVNGVTITRMTKAELGESFTVFHVETENHEIILAEGAASETYIDNGSRSRFENHAEFEALFGAEGRPSVELDRPRAMSPRQVPASVAARIAGQINSVSAKAA